MKSGSFLLSGLCNLISRNFLLNFYQVLKVGSKLLFYFFYNKISVLSNFSSTDL